MNIGGKLLGILALMAVPAAAGAQTITFDAIDQNGPVESDAYFFESYSEQGFTFESQAGYSDGVGTRNSGSPFSADPDGRVIFASYWDDYLVFAPTGGGEFNLHSFDLADWANDGTAGLVGYSYVLNGVETFGNFELDGVVGLQTFNPNLWGISRFGLLASETSTYQLDNVRVSAVPEPGVWATMILGFGAVGFAMRRRRKVQTAVSFA